MTFSWPNKLGVYCRIKAHYIKRSLNPASSQIAQSLRLMNQGVALTLGKAYFMVMASLNMELVGE